MNHFCIFFFKKYFRTVKVYLLFIFLGGIGATLSGSQGFLLYQSVFRYHSWQCSVNYMWCQELNPGQWNASQVLYILFYICGLQIKFLSFIFLIHQKNCYSIAILHTSLYLGTSSPLSIYTHIYGAFIIGDEPSQTYQVIQIPLYTLFCTFYGVDKCIMTYNYH